MIGRIGGFTLKCLYFNVNRNEKKRDRLSNMHAKHRLKELQTHKEMFTSGQ